MDCVRLSHDRVTFDVDRDDCQSSSGDEVDCWRVAICSTLVLCYLCISILINTSSSVLTCYKQRHVNNRHHRLLKTSSIAVETLRSTSEVALSWDKRTKLISYLTPRWTINTYFVTQFGHWGQYERSTVCVWERERERGGDQVDWNKRWSFGTQQTRQSHFRQRHWNLCSQLWSFLIERKEGSQNLISVCSRNEMKYLVNFSKNKCSSLHVHNI